ncbi:GIY-YIG nuclease family protein [Hyphomonas sp. FCG-A18]|uniref:GIY-YIG nuclease family protein n=1 Tax=Hyphomonas sp. FCG-A18 TaxID=3080019 RepID=UPI002B2CC4D9|nr:GIY-YIG nuclease family protein [Hyphomonas sp. FCG-A18]
MADKTAEDLLAELGVEIETLKAAPRSAQEERIIAGFEDIQRFVSEHGRAPNHAEGGDIFERMYAVRLDRLRALPEARALLAPLDSEGLLGEAIEAPTEQAHDPEVLLAELGIDPEATNDITTLKHVRPTAERKAAEEIANRTPCKNFETFRPLFEAVKNDLDDGTRQTRAFVKHAGFLKADIKTGEFFILGGQIAYVAEVGEEIKAPNGEIDARLRVIYSNGTESDLLRRSLQRALYKDEAGRRISEPSAGPLFSGERTDDDTESGTIYVLRSLSSDSQIAQNRDLIHKIGVTGGKVETRISNAANDATYLLADVEIVATYELFNINRVRLEALLHRFFADARLDLEISDRFGKPVRPREWYLVPLDVIDAVVKAVQDGSISTLKYDPALADLVKR